MIVGHTIGHYFVEEKIGEGGMGTVYRALDTRLNRSVALKFFRSETSTSPTDSARLADEARAAAKLSHPNVATVFEYDPQESFIAMEYVEGESLHERLRRGPIQSNELNRIVSQLAAGMSAAHISGIVHRDLKPANIMLKKDGSVKILDFGLARMIDEVRRTDPDRVVGSVAYMSPEQLSGEDPDARSDIWALGVVLFEMLTGRLPFSAGHVPALMYAICHEPLPDLSALAPQAPAHLVRLCQRCLEKDRARRFSSMNEVEQAMRVMRPSRLRSKYRIALGVFILAAGFGFAWLFGVFGPTGPATSRARKVTLAVLKFEDLAPDDSTHDWPLLLQAYVVNQLTGLGEIAVYDQRSLNVLLKKGGSRQRAYDVTRSAGIDLVIEGSIVQRADGHEVLAAGVIPATGESLFPVQATFGSNEDLPTAAGAIARQILDYVHVKLLNESEATKTLQPWVGTRNASALREFIQAGQMIFEGLPSAEKPLRRAIALDSTFISPRIWLIAGLAQQGRMDEAAAEYRRIRPLENNASPFEQAMIGWAGAYLAGDVPAQIHYHELALDYSPGNDILLYALARERFIMKDYAGTLRTLQPAAASGWDYSLVYYLIGASFLELGRDHEARTALEKAATMNPPYPETHALLAVLALRRGDRVEGEKQEKAYYEGMSPARITRSELLSVMGERFANYGLPVQAAERFARARDSNPLIARYHEEFGDMLLQQGFRDSARSAYARAAALDSNDAGAQLMLGTLADSAGDASTAIRCYTSYMHLDPSGADSLGINARIKRLSQ